MFRGRWVLTELRLIEGSGKDELSQYLEFLFESSDGYIYVATREKERGAFHQYYFDNILERDDCANFIRQNTDEKEVYISPSLFRSRNSLRDQFKSSSVVWCELDDGRATTLTQGAEENWELYGLPVPSVRIQSSGLGNEHWYWKLRDSITEATELEAINRSITYLLGADSSGWDANQILRPPGTKNHKRQGVETKLLGDFATVPQLYSRDIFPTNIGPTPVGELDADSVPDVLQTILKYPFSSRAIELFQSTPVQGDGKGRSVALMQLGYFCAEMGMSDLEIFSVIRNADDRWGKFKDRTDRNKRLSDLISRVRIKVPYNALTLTVDEKLPVMGLQTLLAREEKLEWVIPGVLESGGYMLLTGPSGVGKTQLSLQYAIHLAIGKSYLDSDLTKPSKIIFFSLEMGLTALKFFLVQMSSNLSSDELLTLESNLLLVPLGESLYIDGPKDQKRLLDVVTEHQPDGVFIDSLGSSSNGDLNESTVKALMDFNDRLRQRHGVFTWFIHHNRKAQADNRKPNKLSDVYGGQYLVNRATSVFCLWPDKQDIEVIELKKRLAPLGDNWRIKRTASLNFVRIANVTLSKALELSYKQPAEDVDNEQSNNTLTSSRELPAQRPTKPTDTKLKSGL